MSRATVMINNMRAKLDSISGLGVIVDDLLKITVQQVNSTVEFIKKHFKNATALDYYGLMTDLSSDDIEDESDAEE